MENDYFEIESNKPFSESLIWQLNRDFYQEKGISAWSDNLVPHSMTCSSIVGKTYAELILAFLKDLTAKGKSTETVYILELGAGHGRLAFHILKHLEKIESALHLNLPPYCFILSDIVEDNLTFFENHPQFQEYLKKGVLDVSYFDAVKSNEIHLRYNKLKICSQELNQPLLAIGNYFFDSLPNDLYKVKGNTIESCSISLHSEIDTSGMSIESTIENLQAVYHKEPLKSKAYEESILNEILEEYKDLLSNTHLFFPKVGLNCLTNLVNFSKQGLMLLSMDKGYCDIESLDKKEEPDIVTHGSLSLWVNYHALGSFCKKLNGKVLFPTYSTFHSVVGCLLFLPDGDSYLNTDAAYQHYVNDFGPDDYNSIKKLTYANISRLNIWELIALLRLSFYDSTFFMSILPRIKQVAKSISTSDRKRLAETFHQVWKMYFNIGEEDDIAYEIGGLLYDLGYYKDALDYFQYSLNLYGVKEDIYHNQVLCYYQLRQDQLFYKTLNKAKSAFPDSKMFEQLDSLDMNAA